MKKIVALALVMIALGNSAHAGEKNSNGMLSSLYAKYTENKTLVNGFAAGFAIPLVGIALDKVITSKDNSTIVLDNTVGHSLTVLSVLPATLMMLGLSALSGKNDVIELLGAGHAGLATSVAVIAGSYLLTKKLTRS